MTDDTAAERQRRRREKMKDAGMVGFRIHMTVAERTELQVAAAVEGVSMERLIRYRVFGE